MTPVRSETQSATPAAAARPPTSAGGGPVARVLVDVLPAHLDRPFDYTVPDQLAEEARPGTRVKVRFAGREVDGFILGRTDSTDHGGALAPIRRVVSPEPVLSPEIAELATAVARRYAGTRADVLRLAVPPRHARAERTASPPAVPPDLDPAALAALGARWSDHRAGPAFVQALARGDRPRAVWAAAPGADWPALMAAAAAATYAGGRGALLLAPDGRDLDRLDAALTATLGAGHHVVLRADSGPGRRYRDFLAVSRGARRLVVGTRAAAFAPVHDLGLVAIWDDGDDLHAEPRAPYPHAREVLLLRAEQQDSAALVGGFGRTVEAQHLLRAGWAREIAADRVSLRRQVHVSVVGAGDEELDRDPHARAARLPRSAHDLLRSALQTGPVLVQTPRAGYATALACDRCRTAARCRRCVGPLHIAAARQPPQCRWCGLSAPQWVCEACGHRGLRAPAVGEARTAEELGRSFPLTRVLTSSGGSALASVADEPALVVATPGAEPVAEGGYAAVALLDTWLALSRPDLRVAEEALRRWLGAAALVRRGGRVVAVGDPSTPALQALVRWDPGGFADRETRERRSAHLPPASRLATITGDPVAVAEVLAQLAGQADPDGTGTGGDGGPHLVEVLGPVPHPSDGPDPRVRAVARVPRRHGEALSAELGRIQRQRAARKLPAVRIQVDPPTLG